MSITVKEKEHWKSRIAARMEKAIEALYRRGGLELRKQVQQQARQLVLDQFGIRDAYEQSQALDAQMDLLLNQRSGVNQALRERLEELGHSIGGYRNDGLEKFLECEAKLLERDVLQGTEYGREIIRLMDEQEQLLDTVWLATSPIQIRKLWQDVNAILEDEPTPLQSQAMTYEPVIDSK